MANWKFHLRGLRKARLNGDTGQALVELALTMTLLTPILLGAVEFGRFAYMAIEISNAAKAAAQYGAQNGATAADNSSGNSGIQLIAGQEAPYVSNNYTGFTVSVQEPLPCSCVSGGTSTATSCGSTTCAGYIVQNLVITTSATCNSITHIPGIPSSITMYGHALQEVLN